MTHPAKHTLRQVMKHKRKAYSAHDRTRDAEAACAHLAVHPWFIQASVIALYVPIHGEIDPLHVLHRLNCAPPAICPRFVLPKSHPKRGTLSFHLVTDDVEELQPGSPGAATRLRRLLKPGAYGILEPQGPQVPDKDLGLIVVPGLAFDRQGGRLGYGGGYYDKVLARNSTRALGFGYQWQMVEQVPTEDHDITLPAIVTPSGSIQRR